SAINFHSLLLLIRFRLGEPSFCDLVNGYLLTTFLCKKAAERPFCDWYCNLEVVEQNESDGFAPLARRKPPLRLVAFARVATPPGGQRRAFMFQYFRVAVLDGFQ